MQSILIVEKNGSIKEQKIKDYVENELYKKAKFKSPENFQKIATWNLVHKDNPYSISLYGKTTGKAGQENKYDFPPPADNLLLFGNCILLNKKENSEELLPLKENEWDSIYEELFGGFEDIGEEDSDEEESSDEDEYAKLPKTSTGYAKDDFIVDDEDEDSEYEPPVTTKKKTTKTPKKKAPSKKKEKEDYESDILENEQLVYSEELEEEEYI
jgi:hypothetical protein